ncbi:bacillithiol biosynthesis BshC, partial [Klebsiella pneumoniae]|uniref:bacillithiol biosynthesis protein BshC n=1 Tax=Klebsiella pneumoniae TaxID=573 RepID=UPI00272FCE6A
LRATVEARFKSAMKGLERVEKGLVRSAKRKDSVAMQRIDAVHAELFPAGGLQERRENILPLLAARGFGLLDELLELLDPLDPRFT